MDRMEDKAGSVAQVRAVVLVSGATIAVDGRVQRAIAYLVRFQDALNHPALNAKCILNFNGEDCKPTIEANPVTN